MATYDTPATSVIGYFGYATEWEPGALNTAYSSPTIAAPTAVQYTTVPAPTGTPAISATNFYVPLGQGQNLKVGMTVTMTGGAVTGSAKITAIALNQGSANQADQVTLAAGLSGAPVAGTDKANPIFAIDTTHFYVGVGLGTNFIPGDTVTFTGTGAPTGQAAISSVVAGGYSANNGADLVILSAGGNTLSAAPTPTTHTANVGPAGSLGTFQTPTRWLPLTANGFKDTPATVKKQYFSAQRASTRTAKALKIMAGGQIGFPLFWEAGIDLFCGALGADTMIAVTTADTAATIGAASNGRVNITYVTPATYVQGAPLYIDTGANQEVRAILATDPVAKTITVAELNSSHGSPVTISMPGAHKFAYSNLPSSLPAIKKALRAFSVEVNEGGFSRQYATVYAGKFDLKGAADLVEATVDLVGTNPGVPATTPTPWAYTTALDTQIDNPFGVSDGGLIVYNDPTAGGSAASAVRLNPFIDTWNLSFNNGFATRGYWDFSRAHRTFPGAASLTFDYTADNPSGRLAELDDLVLLDIETPVFITLRQNMGTPSSPNWKVVTIYVPTMHLDTAEPVRNLTGVNGVTVKGEARASGADLMQMFVVNENASQY